MKEQKKVTVVSRLGVEYHVFETKAIELIEKYGCKLKEGEELTSKPDDVLKINVKQEGMIQDTLKEVEEEKPQPKKRGRKPKKSN